MSKNNILAIVILVSAFANQVYAESVTKVVSDKTNQITVNLAPDTVKFSRVGYDVPTLKVLVPELAGITLLDHRNRGEGAPCLRINEPRQSRTTPAVILKGGTGQETISVHVVDTVIKSITSVMRNDLPVQVCQVTLREDVDTLIHGHQFVHSLEAVLPERLPEDCQ